LVAQRATRNAQMRYSVDASYAIR